MPADIWHCASEFYLLQLLDAEKRINPFSRAHERWLYDFEAYKELFEEKFAAMLHDYIVLICIGEARHAPRRCKAYVPNFPGASCPVERNTAYRNATKFQPKAALQRCVELFKCSWEDGYGGSSWARIAEAGLLFYNPKVSRVAAIDHCVDLSHNNGLMFNKIEAKIFDMISSTRYRAFLDFKKTVRSLDEFFKQVPCAVFVGTLSRLVGCSDKCIEAQHPSNLQNFVDCYHKTCIYSCSHKLYSLLVRACNLGIVEINDVKVKFGSQQISWLEYIAGYYRAEFEYSIKYLLKYKPIEFGYELPELLKECTLDWGDKDEEDEDNEDEEDEEESEKLEEKEEEKEVWEKVELEYMVVSTQREGCEGSNEANEPNADNNADNIAEADDTSNAT